MKLYRQELLFVDLLSYVGFERLSCFHSHPSVTKYFNLNDSLYLDCCEEPCKIAFQDS